MGLRDWFPRPKALELGGELVLASQLRLGDLAALEDWVAARAGALEDSLDETAPDYLERLAESYDRAESWPPAIGSAEAGAILFGDGDGLALFLLLVLRATPGLTAERARDLAGRIAPAELEELERVAWAVRDDPRPAILRRIDRHLGLPEFTPRASEPGGKAITWAEAVGEVVTRLPWASPAAVAELTIGQWRLVRSGGETEEASDALPEDPALEAQVNAARMRFFGIPELPEAAAAPEAIDDAEEFEVAEGWN